MDWKGMIEKGMNFLKEKIRDDYSTSFVQEKYLPPNVIITVGDKVIDNINQFKGITIYKKCEEAYSFDLELLDMTFELDYLFLNHMLPMSIQYGIGSHICRYKGYIYNSKSTVNLHAAVSISCTGVFTDNVHRSNVPKEYNASIYKGSVFAILTDFAQASNIQLVIRDDVKDVTLKDDSGNPKTVLKPADKEDRQFIRELVSQLDDDVTFTFEPIDPTVADSREKLIVFKMTNSVTGESKLANNLIIDINSRDSIVSSYDIDISQIQFNTYGGSEAYISVDPMTNEINAVDGSISKRKPIDEYKQLIDDASKVVKWLTTPSMTEERMQKRADKRAMQKLSACYNISLTLTKPLPDLQPGITEVTINAWVSSHTNKTGARMHHSSGKYLITEVTDSIKDGVITQSLKAFRLVGEAVNPSKIEDMTQVSGSTTPSPDITESPSVSTSPSASASTPTQVDGSKFSKLYAEARKHLGKPYVYGSKGPNTFDCSGFMTQVYSVIGVDLKGLNAQGMYDHSTRISASQAVPGDMVFFTKTDKKHPDKVVSHVGMIIKTGRMIHAGSPIKESSFTTGFFANKIYGYGRVGR